MQKLTNTALKDHSDMSVKNHLKIKPVGRHPTKRLSLLFKEKIKDLDCHWSGNEEEQVCVDFTFSGLDRINVDGLNIYQVTERRRRCRYHLLLYQMIFVCFNYKSHTVLHTGNVM